MLKANKRLFQSRNLCQLRAGNRIQVGGRAAYNTEQEIREWSPTKVPHSNKQEKKQMNQAEGDQRTRKTNNARVSTWQPPNTDRKASKQRIAVTVTIMSPVTLRHTHPNRYERRNTSN